MRFKLFKMSSPFFDYSYLHSIPSDFDNAKIDAVKAHVNARNQELKEDLLMFQRQLMKRCITEKEYHLGHLNTALDTYDIDVSNKWQRLLGPEQDADMIVQSMLLLSQRLNM
jgi:hypothetical protein